MALSYTTSPAYHIFADKDDSKAAAPFDEGHYLQIEVAAKVAGGDQQALADRFLAFMLTPAFQSVIPRTNWMYPAIAPDAGLPEEFGGLIQPGKALSLPASEAIALRGPATEEWRAALSR